MKHIKLFEEYTANTVSCDNCNWSWEIEDGGKDVFLCHKCGHDNKPVLGESLSNILEANDGGLFDDVEDSDDVFDIDIDLEDEEGHDLDDDPEETGDFPDERARPPRITKKMRKAMTVKSKVVREWLGPDSQMRPVINKIFMKLQKEIKKEAAKQGVPIGNINLDKLTIKR